MTMYELNFSLLVEQMFSKIVEPTYRQVVVEVSTCTLVVYTVTMERVVPGKWRSVHILVYTIIVARSVPGIRLVIWPTA